MENLGIIILFIIFSVVRRWLQQQQKEEPPVPTRPGRRPVPPDAEDDQEIPPVKARETRKRPAHPFEELEELFERFSGQRPQEEPMVISTPGGAAHREKEEPSERKREIRIKEKPVEKPRQKQEAGVKPVTNRKTEEPLNLEVLEEEQPAAQFTAENAVTGIIFSEVLGPPRSRKPFSLRQTNKLQS